MNLVGLVAALAAFCGIWLGHVAVRKIESVSPTIWLPTTVFAVLGITFEWLSLNASHFLLSAFLGIIGFTLLWDALEFTRQQKRVTKGHAPANPDNPRHARLMRDHTSATTLDLLKRDPLGKSVSQAEAVKLVAEH